MRPESAKKKGRESENAVAAFLADRLGYPIERRRLAGQHDRGDLAGLPGWTIQVKSSLGRPAEALDQLEAQVANTGDPWGAVIARRRGMPHDVGAWYFLVPVWRGVDLIREVGA